MNHNDIFPLLMVIVSVAVPVLIIGYIFRRYFAYKEKELGSLSGVAAEKAAQYASRTKELEQRVRVLEQIVTDGGAQTAAQIEALRENPAALVKGD